jgi:uncharacterized membrane protein YbhN (UPF0104 family)
VPRLAALGLANLLDAFLDGFAFARHPIRLAQVIFWTIVHWILSAIAIVFALLAVGIDGASVSDLIQMTLLVMVATNLSMAIPSAPGYVGVFHGVFVATLTLFAVREDLAAAAAIVAHASVFGVFVIGGTYYLWRGEAVQASGRHLRALVTRARVGTAGVP